MRILLMLTSLLLFVGCKGTIFYMGDTTLEEKQEVNKAIEQVFAGRTLTLVRKNTNECFGNRSGRVQPCEEMKNEISLDRYQISYRDGEGVDEVLSTTFFLHVNDSPVRALDLDRIEMDKSEVGKISKLRLKSYHFEGQYRYRDPLGGLNISLNRTDEKTSLQFQVRVKHGWYKMTLIPESSEDEKVAQDFARYLDLLQIKK